MKIFVISLVDATNRRDNARKQLHDLGIDFDFFDALTADNGYAEYFEAYDELRYLINTGRKATSGEIGCYASHKALWRRCIEMQQPVMIMEDDFLLSEDFADAFAQSQKLVKEYGFIRLQTEHRGKRKFVKKSGRFNVVYYTKMPHSLMCYAITPEIAEVFVQSSKHLSAPVDVMIKKIWQHKQRLYGLMPYTVSEDKLSVMTSIDGRVKSRKSPAVKFLRFLTKISWVVRRQVFSFNFRPPV